MHQKFQVTGMSCSACSARVEKTVSKLSGVSDVTVNLLTGSMIVDYDDAALTASDICQAVSSVGYGADADAPSPDGAASAASVKDGQFSKNQQTSVRKLNEEAMKNMRFRLIISFIFMAVLMYIAMGHMIGLPVPLIFEGAENALIFAFTQMLLTLPVMYVNRKYYINGFKSLVKGSPNMDTLIATGSSAAFIYGLFAIYQLAYGLGHQDMARVHEYMHDLYFESAAMILTLITLGKYFETRSKGKTSEAIEKLISLAPKTAIRLENGTENEIPAEAVRPGDILLIKPGTSIPVDGIVVDGYSSVDESALTGESIPVEKSKDARVLSASINGNGILKIRAEKVGADSTLSQIIRLVEEAGATKAPIARLADKVSGIFVPVVMVIALIAFIIWYFVIGESFSFALSIGIAVLVISCPCALGLATPVAIMVGTGKGASLGVLIKSGDALETAHKIKAVVLDKTGTITEGKPQVTDILPSEGFSGDTLLALAASIEQFSEHPLAGAVMACAKAGNITFTAPTSFEVIPGQGVLGDVDGKHILAGNLRMMESFHIPAEFLKKQAKRLSDEGKTPLYFACDGKAAGIIAAADTVKPTSRRAIKEFHRMGIRVTMLTGDNKNTANAVAKNIGIDDVVAEVLPQDKARAVTRLQKDYTVAMVGDGINDAPALAAADVGIAIGAGMDIAIESADIVLMKNDLLDAVTAIQLSKKVIQNIKENLFWAFFYNTIGIPLAAGVFYTAFGLKLNPMIGAAAMSFSSVCVVTNALRLKLFKPKLTSPTEDMPAGKSHISTPELNINKSLSEDKQTKNQETSQMGEAININLIKESECLTMEKTMIIDGMMCSHCSGRVTQVLNAIDGVSAVVSLEDKNAKITLTKDVPDDVLIKAVTDAGYTVVSLN